MAKSRWGVRSRHCQSSLILQMNCIKSVEWDSGTTKRLSKNLSDPSALERVLLPSCQPAEAVGSKLDPEKWQSRTEGSVRLADSTWTFCVC